MYRLHDSIVKLWIMYEGTEKIKKYEIRLFVIETTKNLMNLMAFELVTYRHISSHIVTISLPLVRGKRELQGCRAFPDIRKKCSGP